LEWLKKKAAPSVVPTPVGVNREFSDTNLRRTGCPHARGGEPYARRGVFAPADVVPTPVGVNRQFTRARLL